MSRTWRLATAAAFAIVVVVASAPRAGAHPLGNFSSNTYAGLEVRPDRIAIDYVLDLAEIPTQQAMPAIDADGDGTVSTGESSSYRATTCRSLAAGVSVSVDGAPVTVSASEDTGRLTFPEGLAGLSLLRLECELSAPVTDLGQVEFHDGNAADRVGWHEVTASGSGVELSESDVPTASPSTRLTDYTTDSAALSVRDARFVARIDGSAAPAAGADETARRNPSSAPDGATRLFTSLVAERHLTLGFASVAVLLSAVLGAFHALAPGHGKTVMAAYIVGRRGTARHAAAIGLTVAATHTIGVLVLGLVLWSSDAVAGERVYPVLGIASGLVVAAVGVSLLARVVRAARTGTPILGHSHGTGPGQHTHAWIRALEHDHHDHDHDHDHGHHARHHHHDRNKDHGRPRVGGIVAMGVAGGMVPSPSAVLVLLGALALDRAWFGVVLVLAYGIGMALTLLAAGLLLVRAQDWLGPWLAARAPMVRLAAFLPVLSSLAVIGGGLLLATRAALG